MIVQKGWLPKEEVDTMSKNKDRGRKRQLKKPTKTRKEKMQEKRAKRREKK